MKPSPDELERLIDILLEDELGRKEPTDLTHRVLTRAFPTRRNRIAPTRRNFYVWGAVAAAAVALAAGVWLVLPSRYPDPVAEGSYTLESAGALRRGAVLRTDGNSATLKLGGYCSVILSPNSKVSVEGQPRSECVALLLGEVRCLVDKNIGAFDVKTPAGIVSVRGTEFLVGLQPKSREASKPQDYVLTVTVVSGKVNVNHDGKDLLLQPGPARIFGAAAAPSPIRSEDPPSQRLPIEIDGENNALAHGVVEGFVKNKSDKSLDVTSISGKTETYFPEWEGRQNGGPNRQMVSQILRLKIGARVRIHWYVDNKIRIQALDVLENKGTGGMDGF